MSLRRAAIAIRRGAGSVRSAIAILALFAAFGLIGISDPPSGLHRWREADTCTVAWNMATGDGDLLHPRVNARGTGTGTTKQEFPLYNWLTAEGWRAFGWNHAVPRGLAVAFALLGMWSLRSLVLTLGGGPRVANLALLCLASAPLWAFYARKIIPDVPAAAVSLAGFALFARWLRGGGPAWIPAAALLALGGVMKPLTLCIGLPIVWCLLRARGWRGMVSAPALATGALVAGTLLAWVAYAQSITDPQVAWYFTFGIERQATLQALMGGEPLKRLFIEWPWQMWISMPLVIGFPLALWRFPRLPLVPLALAWLAAAWLVLLPFAVKFGPHDYYAVVAAPPMALLVAIGLARLMAWPRAGACIVACLLLAVPISTWLRIDQRYGRSVDLVPARELAAGLMPAGQRLVVCEATPSYLLYAFDRTGWWGQDVGQALGLAATTDASFLVVDERMSGFDRVASAIGSQPIAAWGSFHIWSLRRAGGDQR